MINKKENRNTYASSVRNTKAKDIMNLLDEDDDNDLLQFKLNQTSNNVNWNIKDKNADFREEIDKDTKDLWLKCDADIKSTEGIINNYKKNNDDF